MHLATVHSRACRGLEAIPVKVEVHIAPGLPVMHIVGLPETAVRESKHRVRAALSQNRFEFPCRRITVNLAPADLPKEGGRFDLPIALGILAASGQLPADAIENCEFISELSLSGSLLPVRGIIPAVLAAAGAGRSLVIPADNAAEAGLVGGQGVYTASHLLEVYGGLLGEVELKRVEPHQPPPAPAAPDMRDVRGQRQAVRAVEIAAAGRHHCLMLGSPGSGKTMLANRLPGILPPMGKDEAVETAAVMSLGSEPPDPAHFYRRPFRSPHHSCTAVALVGGGASEPRPGEISKAHNGVLFLDELLEFSRQALDALREPIESGTVHISRAGYSVSYPSRFQLIAAMNPCPDGSDTDETGRCPCSEQRLMHYYRRLSAPMLDRIDIHIRVPRVRWSHLENGGAAGGRGEPSKVIRRRTVAARRRQLERQGCPNACLGNKEIEKFCVLSDENRALLNRSAERLQLSARACYRVLKVARTIADLAAADTITRPHLLEAVSYRSLDQLLK